jgi:hypothetical protein
MNNLQVPQQGPYEQSCPFTGSFYVSLKFLIKIPLNKEIFSPSLKGPRKGLSLHVPQNQDPCGNMPILKHLILHN